VEGVYKRQPLIPRPSLSIHLIFGIMSVPPKFAGLKLLGASQETPHTLEMCMSSQGSSYGQTS
jgi:hypothetical protein